MSTVALAFGDCDLPDRNRRAAATIDSIAAIHSGADAAIGLIGFAPFPGAPAVAIAVALTVQVPIYLQLAEELSNIYETPEDEHTKRHLWGNMGLDITYTVSADLALHAGKEFLLKQFGKEFLFEIKWELLQEMGLGGFFSFIPILGGFASVGIDIWIAQKMTRRVGTLICAYYQNGRQFPGGSRKEGYKRIVKTGADKGPPEDIRKKIPEINENLVKFTMKYVERLLEVARKTGGSLSDSQLREMLREYPADIADEAIRRVLKGN